MGWAWMSPYVVCYDSIYFSEFYANRGEMLFKRKPFEYPIFLSPINCPCDPISPAAYDPFRYLFSFDTSEFLDEDRLQHL